MVPTPGDYKRITSTVSLAAAVRVAMGHADIKRMWSGKSKLARIYEQRLSLAIVSLKLRSGWGEVI